MGPHLTAIILGMFCVAVAYAFRPRGYPFVARAAAFWIVVLPFIFLLNLPLAELAICALAIAVLLPAAHSDRAPFYLLTLPAVPTSIAGPIPFPGLNYLINLDFAKVVCLVILIPMLFAFAPKDALRRIPAAGVFFAFLSVYYGIQSSQFGTITDGLRVMADTFLLYAVPYLALSRAISRDDSFDKIAAAFLFLAAIYAVIAAISQLRGWNFYAFAAQGGGFTMERFGLVRISATSTPFMLGFIALLGLLAVNYFRNRKAMPAMTAWLYRAGFAYALLVTVSRGAWVGAAAGMAIYWFFTSMPRSIRPTAAALAFVVGVPLIQFAATTTETSKIDEFGTFAYRQEVLRVSLEQLRERPIFGDLFYLEHPRFDKLVQGEGIVDVVNHYLEIALARGLFGLGLYLAAWTSVLISLLSLGKIVRQRGSRELELQRAFLLAALGAMLVILATTSAAGIATHVSVALLGVAGGFAAREKAKATAHYAAINTRPRSDGPPGGLRGDLGSASAS